MQDGSRVPGDAGMVTQRSLTIGCIAPLAALLLFAGLITAADASERGVTCTGSEGIHRTTAEIMAVTSPEPAGRPVHLGDDGESEGWDREGLAQAEGAGMLAQWPASESRLASVRGEMLPAVVQSPQIAGTSFRAVSYSDVLVVPPDAMGAMGPAQYTVFINHRIRTFTRAGVRDGAMDVSAEAFFAAVMTPLSGTITSNSTLDPQIRFDRLSGRWILTAMDLPCGTACPTANRILIAVSDAASAGVISANTVWTFFSFQPNATNFVDMPSLSVDAKALYISANVFTPSLALAGVSGFVVRKSSILGAGPIVVTTFALLPSLSAEGMVDPRSVDNDDPASNEGYFIGTSALAFGRLVLRRVSDPGGSPTISSNLTLTVNATSTPIPVDHLGNTGGPGGRLASGRDQLGSASMRGGRLWTSQSIAVTAAGVGSESDSQRRNGVRWYELTGIRSSDNGGVPAVVQSGTLYDPAATVSTARQYWHASMAVSGQGHAALGFSTAGTPYRANAATAGRLASDPPGTLGAIALLTNSTYAYNRGTASGSRRWGEYSHTCLDPADDMTLWTIQQFCDSTNSWGCQVTRLLAPPPATPSSTDHPGGVEAGLASVTVVVTGASTAGSGFYDPGANRSAPATPFAHLTAHCPVTGGVTQVPVVNNVTYLDATHVRLDLDTRPALPNQAYSITVTNPDGQSSTGLDVLTVVPGQTDVRPPAERFALDSVTPNPTTGRALVAYTVGREIQVRVSILDLQGREVAVLAHGIRAPGQYTTQWSARRRGGEDGAGVYFVRYRAGDWEEVRRVVVTK